MADAINPPQIRHMATLWDLDRLRRRRWRMVHRAEDRRDQKCRVRRFSRSSASRHRRACPTVWAVVRGDCRYRGGQLRVEPKLQAIKEVGAVCVNVQMLDHDTSTEESITRARQVMEAAGKLEMDVAIEVHRDTCTETPEKAYALAEGFEEAEGRPLKMTWDFLTPRHYQAPVTALLGSTGRAG